MVAINETTIAMVMAGFAVVSTLVYYVLLWYGVSSLRDIRNTLNEQESTNEQ